MNTPHDDSTEIAAEALTRRVVLCRIGGLSAAVTDAAASIATARADDRAMLAHQATPRHGAPQLRRRSSLTAAAPSATWKMAIA